MSNHTQNSPSSSNTTSAIKSHNLLKPAFSGLLLLATLIAAVGLIHSQQNFVNLQSVVEYLNVKSGLISHMQHRARESSIALYAMTTLDDLQERKDIYMIYHRYGEEFTNAHLQLLKMELSAEELELLQQHTDLATNIRPFQTQVVELAMAGEQKSAQILLTTKVVPLQNLVFNILGKLEKIQHEAATNTTTMTKAKQQQVNILIIILCILALAIGVYIARFTINRITQSERQVHLEKELAEVTLSSIGDAVITTDLEGKITFMNPVAEQLTGFEIEDAMDLYLTEVFNIRTESERRPAKDPIEIVLIKNAVLYSPHDIILIRKDYAEFAIEHTASPIMDHDQNIHGVIVVFRDVTEMRSLSYKLSYQATHDSLTGLVNRREFEIRLEQAINNARTENNTHALCYMDLDQFKLINDAAGHAAGDEFLKQVAHKLSSLLRKSDVLARLGGDEFGILLEGCDEQKAMEITNNLRKAIKSTRFSWGKNSFEVGASIGLVPISACAGSVSDVLSNADTACYEAKEKGRNRIQVYHPDDVDLSRRRGEMRWAHNLSNALDNDNFTLYCQDIIALQNQIDDIHFCELLIRMEDEHGKLIPPMAFIPAAERYNMMPSIDHWVLTHALSMIEKNKDIMEDSNYMLSINMSGQSLSERRFLDFVIDAIKNTSINPDSLCFEITETAAIANLSRMLEFIKRLKELGCMFALDDFGSGLSSFSYLKNMPVDYLKIDGSFVRDICHDPMDMTFVEAIHRIGKMMKINTIAEFVETEETLIKLKEIGISYAQGYHIGKPYSLFDAYFEKSTTK